ncbi:MAG TPA: Wadjet anti-phage system protein JetD domain-containing protein [Marinagarivorans sp.]
MLQAFDPVSQQLIQTLVNLVNRSTGVVNGARLPVSSQFAGSYVYASPNSRRVCHEALKPLEDMGLIECGWHLKVLEDFETLKHIQVPRGKAFLEYLGISPQVDMVANAATTLAGLKCGVDWIDHKVNEIGERWRLGARYLSLGPEHIPQVVIAATVAKKLATEPLRGRNIRALSLDWFGAAHTIDEHKQVITLFCESQIHPAAKELDYVDQLASLGLIHASSLLHMRGPFEAICDDDKLIDVGGWSGAALCGEFVRGFERTSVPAYVLTIEDLTLYQRYIAAVQDNGLVMYIGDFPTARTLGFFEKLVDKLPPEVPLYHWGNIDLAGFKSLLALQSRLLVRRVLPFNMSAEQLLANPIPGGPLGLSKLRKLAFSCQKEVRDTLIGIASLPEEKVRECPSDSMVVTTPKVALDA